MPTPRVNKFLFAIYALGTAGVLVAALAMRAHGLCQRMTVLENYRLVSQSQADLEADSREIASVRSFEGLGFRRTASRKVVWRRF